jgi:hypothetical protein
MYILLSSGAKFVPQKANSVGLSFKKEMGRDLDLSCPVVLVLSSLWDRETVTKKEGIGLPLLPLLKTKQVGQRCLSQ